jgi:hypothetical protein
MRRLAIAALAVFALGLGFRPGVDEAIAQGGNVVGGYGFSDGYEVVVTDAGGVYLSTDGGAVWTYQGDDAPPGLVDICCLITETTGAYGNAFGITASGHVWRCMMWAEYYGPFWEECATLSAATDFVSIDVYPHPSQWFSNRSLRATTACGDVWGVRDPGASPDFPCDWFYMGNVFANGPSPTETKTWGDVKGEFRE